MAERKLRTPLMRSWRGNKTDILDDSHGDDPQWIATARDRETADAIVDTVNELTARAETLEAENARLRSALSPFRFFGQQINTMVSMLRSPEDTDPDDTQDTEIITAANGEGSHVTLKRGHFLNAYEAFGTESE